MCAPDIDTEGTQLLARRVPRDVAALFCAVTVHGLSASVLASSGPWARRARGERVSRDDLIQATGSVDKVLGGGRYLITLESGQTVTAQLSGRMRRFRIRVIPGDRVQVGLSPYDPTHGFITFRLRDGDGP